MLRFLLAQLHFASLVGKDTPKAIRKALQSLATGSQAYDAAYELAMERIRGQLQEHAERAKQVISWITCAKRPLTKLELQHALAVEVDEVKLDEENLPQIEDAVSMCAGLVTVDEESNIVRLVHYTTQDYFIRTQHKWFPDAELFITTICTTYLSYRDFASGYCKSDQEFEKRLGLHPFYDYAARNWGHHGRKASASQNVVSFLQKPAEVEASSQALLVDSKHRWGDYSQAVPKRVAGLHLAAYFGLNEVVATVRGALDSEDSYSQTPLSWAAANGQEAIVRLLLATKQVDPNSRDRHGKTPLWRAVEQGHEAIVRILLATEQIDPNSRDRYGETPLSWAVEQGHEAIVGLLLATERINPGLKSSRHGETPLLRAAANGQEAIVRLLLATEGVDPDSKDDYGHTPLSTAKFFMNEAVVRLLEDYCQS